MAKQKILVTGANGQLGMELQRLASQQAPYDFIFLSRSELAIEQAESAERLFQLHRPGFCINCAAYTAVDKAEAEKGTAFLINGEAAGALAAISKKNNCRFIHISTDYVFDGKATAPYKENAKTNPQSVYGASKLSGEINAMKENADSIIIRTSWVYSAYGKNFVKTMLKLMSERKEINVVNDQVGSPTYAADLAETIMQIISKSDAHDLPTGQAGSRPAYRTGRLTTHGIYHFSNDGIISWYDFAVAIKELTGSDCKVNPISTSQYPTAAKRPAYSVLNKTKIQQTFGIKLYDWKGSLAKCIRQIS